MKTSKSKALDKKKLEVKSRKGDIGFDTKWGMHFNPNYSVKSDKHYERTKTLKGYSKSKRAHQKPLSADDIPF